jgi:hypothetical protein
MPGEFRLNASKFLLSCAQQLRSYEFGDIGPDRPPRSSIARKAGLHVLQLTTNKQIANS